MGEYANFNGKQIKIGTCEDMHYLRYNQRRYVDHIEGNVDPSNDQECLSIRFRFPWPDEDDVQPGEFDNYNRSIAVDIGMPSTVEHFNIQFCADAGYLVSLPCPESGKCPVPFARNGFSGAVRLAQQKLLADGRLVPIMQCGGCGSKWRIEDEAEITALADWCFQEGNRRRRDSRIVETGEEVGHLFWHKIAQRILAGAKIELPQSDFVQV